MATGYRNGTQHFATVALIKAYTGIVNRPSDSIFIDALQKEFFWLPASTIVGDDTNVIDQAAETANGRWVSSTASFNDVLAAASVPSMDNAQSVIVSFAVPTLAVGTPITVSAKNADVAYGGAVIPAGIRIEYPSEVRVANTVSIEVHNETGLDATTAFTLNVQVTKLA
jgi:hypothetical protein